MNDKQAHAAGPWHTGTLHAHGGPYVAIVGQNRREIATLGQRNAESEANASFIVRAVNSFDAMREALEDARSLILHNMPVRERFDGTYNKICAALALAEKGGV